LKNKAPETLNDEQLKEIEFRLRQGCEQIGLDLADSKYKQILAYLNLLIRWNKAYNLTSVRDPFEMVDRHILDSLSILPYVEGQKVLDVGTGAGLPGMVLAIVKEDQDYVLLDSNGKKTRFLTQVCLELGLKNVVVENSRIEKYQYDDCFDVILTRAFASLSEMLELSGHLLKSTTRILAMKAHILNDEISTLPEGFIVDSVKSLQVPGLSENRNLVVLRSKADNTARKIV